MLISCRQNIILMKIVQKVCYVQVRQKLITALLAPKDNSTFP